MLCAFTLAVVVILSTILSACNAGAATSAGSPPPSAAPALQTADYKITGPYEHQNLTLFLIHAPDKIPNRNFLTLSEALAQKKVILHETGDVNELAVENVSDDDIFIQSGEIVKGGKQDRTLQNDLVLGPKSGKIPVAAFCVEQGRWQKRGNEDSSLFSSSSTSLSSKSLKLAAKGAGDQGAVWSSVGQAQGQLSENAGVSVNARESASSLQLSLENKEVQQAVDNYRKALQQAPAGKPDVVGYAFAVNGKLNSVDIYGSHNLFAKLWDKNLQAAATEAFAEYKKDAKWEPVAATAVKSCLDDAAAAKATNTEEHHKVKLVTRESVANRAYETYTPNAPAPAHVNILTRDPETDKLLQQRRSNDNAPQMQQRQMNQPAPQLNQSDITR